MSTKVRPVLRIARDSAASVLGRAYAIDNGMSADTTRFAAPNPPLSTLKAQIAKVEDAEKQARARTKGAAQTRDLECERLVRMLDSERGYVKTLCDDSPEEASVIIQSAGMICSAARGYSKPAIKITHGAAPCTVDLVAATGALLGGRSSKNKVFHWQWTADGGRTFTDAPATSTGKTTIANLPPLTVLGFRSKVTTSTTSGAWSPVVSIVVH